MKAQGFDRKKSAYFSSLQPYLSIWGVFWCTTFILVNGFEVFFTWNVQMFLTDYISVAIFFGFFIFWKVYKRTKHWKPLEMDFVTVRSLVFILPFTSLCPSSFFVSFFFSPSFSIL